MQFIKKSKSGILRGAAPAVISQMRVGLPVFFVFWESYAGTLIELERI